MILNNLNLSTLSLSRKKDICFSVLAKRDIKSIMDYLNQTSRTSLKTTSTFSLSNTLNKDTVEKLFRVIAEGKLDGFVCGDERMEWYEWKDKSHPKWEVFRRLASYLAISNPEATFQNIESSANAIVGIVMKDNWKKMEAVLQEKKRLASLGLEMGWGEELPLRNVVKKFPNWKDKETADFEMFNQPAIIRGTGFLIARNLLLTAAHNIENEDGKIPLSDLRFVFNFKLTGRNQMADNVFVVSAQHIERQGQGYWDDWVLIRLADDPRLKSINPLQMRILDGIVPDETNFYSWGFPYGTPMKVSLVGAKVMNLDKSRFICNLDLSNGNSGSPIISMNGGNVQGLLTSGFPDFCIEGGKITRKEMTVADIFQRRAGEHCISAHAMAAHIGGMFRTTSLRTL